MRNPEVVPVPNLQLEQTDLLLALAQATDNSPQRESFVATLTHDGACVLHSGLPEGSMDVHWGDLAFLADSGYLHCTRRDSLDMTFDVSPSGQEEANRILKSGDLSAFYHVEVVLQGGKVTDYEMDLTRASACDVARGYVRDEQFMVNGRKLTAATVDRLRIAASRQPAASIREQVEAEHRRRNYADLAHKWEWHVVAKSQDVTRELMEGASESPRDEVEGGKVAATADIFDVLQRQRRELDNLPPATDSQAFVTWKHKTAAVLRAALGERHELVAEFAKLSFYPSVGWSGMTSSDYAKAFESDRRNAIGILEAAVFEIAQLPGQPQGTDTHGGDPAIVFVVHGRDRKAAEAMSTFLTSIGLHALEWSEAVRATGKGSPYVGEVLTEAFSMARAIVVLMTPDDEAQLRECFREAGDAPFESTLSGQARPNVLFEAGMAMGRDEDRTILVEIGQLRPFSDVGGRHTLRFDGSTQRRQELAERLNTAGCSVSLSGTRWHTAGDFSSALGS